MSSASPYSSSATMSKKRKYPFDSPYFRRLEHHVPPVRVTAEARKRAAEKAAAEAREKAAAEARDKAAAEAREKAAAERAAREQQRKTGDDLEAFFASTSRPASNPKQRSPARGAASDVRQPNKGFSTEGSQRNSNAANSSRRVTQTSPTDDWTSLFGNKDLCSAFITFLPTCADLHFLRNFEHF
ncbi:hypothetical protein KP509_22G037700 [Ceratopteris richardii]|uniref:Uncharacterized protein n=1 Tax=Ceratopteris richardii TaxID=49495 RepID=A0A8T2S6T4_CERRI|nr:hypothetical protein KP509_22G037700 [Ceratopteris richardii]